MFKNPIMSVCSIGRPILLLPIMRANIPGADKTAESFPTKLNILAPTVFIVISRYYPDIELQSVRRNRSYRPRAAPSDGRYFIDRYRVPTAIQFGLSKKLCPLDVRNCFPSRITSSNWKVGCGNRIEMPENKPKLFGSEMEAAESNQY